MCRSPIMIISSLVLAMFATTTLLDTGGDARDGGGGSVVNALIQFGFIGAAIIVIARITPTFSNMYTRSPSAIISGSFVIWAMLTILWSSSPLLTLEKSLQFGLFILAAALVANSLCDHHDIATILAISFIIFIAILIGINILTWHKPFPMVPSGVLPDEPAAVAEATDRVRLILARMHPVGVGHLLALAAICTALSRMPIIAKLACCPLMILGIWMADVRTALIALLLVIALLGIRRAPPTMRLLIGSVSSVAILLAVAAYFDDELNTTITYITTDRDISTFDGRTDVWAHVTHLIQDRWISGVGFYASRNYIMNYIDWGATHSHNSFLEVALCTGIIGTVIFLIFVGYTILAVWRINTNDDLLLGIIIYDIFLGSLESVIFSPTLPMFILMIVMIHYDYRMFYHHSVPIIQKIERSIDDQH